MTRHHSAQLLTNEEMKQKIEGAFLPDTVVVKIWDYGKRISFQVKSAEDGSALCTMDELITDDFRRLGDFEDIILNIKHMVHRKRFPGEGNVYFAV